MSTYAYQRVLQQAQNLPPAEQVRLIGEIISGLQRKQSLAPVERLRLIEEIASESHQQQTGEQPRHNIMEWKGVGKEHWCAIDVDKYIAEERASWDG